MMSIGRNMAGPISYIITKCQSRDKTSMVLKAVYLSLQIIDLGLTIMAVHCGYPELNPLMKNSLDSVYKLVIFKFGMSLLITWFVPGRFLIPAILLLGGVVGWNIKELILLAF